MTRERDELLALLDVQEKMKYVKTHNNAEDENDKYSSFSSTEVCIVLKFLIASYIFNLGSLLSHIVVNVGLWLTQ